MDLNERIRLLFERRTLGIRPGLDVMSLLLERLDRPHLRGNFIHVAGTNGKGSVCAMLDAVLRSAGLRVGLYTSPHLVRFNERFRVNGEEIEDRALQPLMERVERAAEEVEATGARAPTFFECSTAIAFLFFAGQGVDLTVLETGMGGRLDATNVVTPLLSVITRIDLDHQQYLGSTLEAIAGEKAGIIKPARPVAIGDMPPEAEAVLRAKAATARAPLLAARELAGVNGATKAGVTRVTVELSDGSGFSFKRDSLAHYQLENMTTALAACVSLRRLGVSLSDDALKQGMSAFEWSGRFQVVARDPDIVVDGAHNPGGAKALAQALAKAYGRRPLGIIAGMCGDKDVGATLRTLTARARRVWLVRIPSERSIDPAEALKLLTSRGVAETAPSLRDALAQAVAWATNEGGYVVICGSLFLAGEALGLLSARVARPF